jgi:hypothetical protein
MSFVAVYNTTYALANVYYNDMKTPMGSVDTLLLDIDCMIATIYVHGSCIHRYLFIACLLSLWNIVIIKVLSDNYLLHRSASRT